MTSTGMPVALRISPFHGAGALQLVNNTVTVADERNHFQSRYEQVFTEASSYSDIFTYVQHTITLVSRGFSGALVVYGQTSADKHSVLFGAENGQPALAALSVSKLFTLLSQSKPRNYTVLLSALVLYNESVFDLLHSQGLQTPLSLRESPSSQLAAVGAILRKVTTADAAIALMREADAQLQSSEVQYSACTTIYRFYITAGKAGRNGAFRAMTFDLCAVAGVERHSGKCSPAFRQSLNQLGKIVYSLANTGKVSPAAFSGSKLTRLIERPVLTGYVCFLVTVSPLKSDVESTIAALKFADIAKSVPCRLRKAKLSASDARLIQQLQKEVNSLRDFFSARDTGLQNDDTFVAIGSKLSIQEVERLFALRSQLYERLGDCEEFADFQRARDCEDGCRGAGSTQPVSRVLTRTNPRSEIATSGMIELLDATFDELMSSDSLKPLQTNELNSSVTQVPSPYHTDRRENRSVPPASRESERLLPVLPTAPLQFLPHSEPYLSFDQVILDRKRRKDSEREESAKATRRKADEFRHQKIHSIDEELSQRAVDEEMKKLLEEKMRREQLVQEKLQKDQQDLISLRNKMVQRPKIEPKPLKPRNHLSQLKEMLLQ